MGKPKKGRKDHQDEEFEDGVDTDLLAQGHEEVENLPKVATGRKGKKGRRKKDEDWEDDVAAEIEALSLGAQSGKAEDVSNGQVEGGTAQRTKRQKKKKMSAKAESDEEEGGGSSDDDIGALASLVSNKAAGQRPKISAFQMLDMLDDNDDDSEQEEEEVKPVERQGKRANKSVVEGREEVVQEKAEIKQETTKLKKGKKGMRKIEEREDDIDALLAEIESAPTKKSGKTSKKNKEKMAATVEEEGVAKVGEDASVDLKKDISEMTEEELAQAMGLDDDSDADNDRKKKKKKKGQTAEVMEEKDKEEKELDEDAEDAGGTVKTAAQKKKEKKERQKQKKLEEKKGKKGKTEPAEETKMEMGESLAEKPALSADQDKTTANDAPAGDEEEGESKKKKKDRKKKKGEKEKEEPKKPSKMVRAMQEALRIQQEEEERLRREAEEKERRLQEALRAKEEKEREEQERKERAKQKKKEKIERAKMEGRFKTPKQKEAERRAQQMLEVMKAQGLSVPQATEKPEGEKKKRIIYNKKKKAQLQQNDATEVVPQSPEVEEAPEVQSVAEDVAVEDKNEPDEPEVAWDADADDVKDAWDAESDEEQDKGKRMSSKRAAQVRVKQDDDDDDDDEDDEEESEEDEEDEESDEDSEEETEEESSEEEESDDGLSPQERAREKALARIKMRKEQAEKKMSTEVLRAPVVCVLGHVDTGKTKILDKLRRTNVQDGEAGGITQQIGATNVPLDTIREQTKMCKEFAKQELRVPGLLIIDTPGHESFSNLRTRGSSLCDIAILVVDIMHGLEPQTIESINLLKQRKCPFVVALNKIDRLFQWQSNPHSDVANTIKKQKPNTKQEFQERVSNVHVQFAEQGLNVALFYENKNPKEFISLVPTSAHSGDGMGNLMALICQLSQTFLQHKVAYSEELQATVMEVKEITGLGTTIDVILVNGSIRESDTIVVPGTEGPIVTQIRGLLMPKPLRELRVKGAYDHVKEVQAAQGVKIIAKDLEKAMAGLPLYVAEHLDEVDIFREELSEALAEVLSGIKLQDRGVFVQASTLGSLEALLAFLKDSKIPYAGINIGPVHKKDIMKTSAMLERDSQYAVVLAFDVKVEREAQELADSLGVRIFTADIIYHLFDKFTAYRDELKKQKQEEFKHIAVFPCKLRIIPQYIFNSRDPIVVGVSVEAGFLKDGTVLCVPSREFLVVGRVTSIEVNHKPVNRATTNQEVCIKIEPVPGEAPKMYGRHFDESDLLVSKISRPAIDAVKDYFREEMSKSDWQLMVELKKIFEII